MVKKRLLSEIMPIYHGDDNVDLLKNNKHAIIVPNQPFLKKKKIIKQ